VRVKPPFVLGAPLRAVASPIAGTVEPRLVTPPRNEIKTLSPGSILNRLVTIHQPPERLRKGSFVFQANLAGIGASATTHATSLHGPFTAFVLSLRFVWKRKAVAQPCTAALAAAGC
jgi:hypothetical protein